MKKDMRQKDVLKAFDRVGFHVHSVREHIKLRNNIGITVSLPNHKTLKGSTVGDAVRLAGLNKKEFFATI